MCDTDLEPTTDEETTPTSSRGVARETSDPRLEPISAYTLTTLRLKPDKWQKMMATDVFRLIVLEWLNNAQRRILVMTLSPGGQLLPKNSLSDLYLNYAIHTPAAATAATTTTATTEAATIAGADAAAPSSASAATTSATATVAASAAMAAATALLVPLPPPSSSFSTLDGVPRGKCAYFVRRRVDECDAVELTTENFHAEVLCGDLPVHSQTETLALLFDEVFRPLLENSLNRKQWPEVVGKDLQARMKEVRNTLTEIKGKTNNRTILSLLVSPTIIEDVASHVNRGDLSPAIDIKFRNLLEEMFINWTTQIHEIISERSECVTNTTSQSQIPPPGVHITAVALPAHEVTFWSNRKHNLQNIYEQLRTPPHKTLAFILERIESAYQPSFAKVFRRLVWAWHEAQDVTLWLQPLLRQTTAFNAVNFNAAHELVAPLVHVLHLIWTNARYYRSTQRMSVLLRCCCNLLVLRAGEDLEFPQLFHCDADEGLAKIDKTIELLELFKSILLQYKEKYASSQAQLPPIASTSQAAAAAVAAVAAQALFHAVDNSGDPSGSQPPVELQQLWRFSNEEVFGHSLEGFLAQLSDMRKIFEAAVSFQNLEKLEIGGLRGKFLTERVKKIHEEFKALFEEWTTIEIDLSPQQTQNIKLKNFKREQVIFFGRMEVLEKKLATILVQAFEDCHNWEQLVKLTLMFGSILQRQTIQPELQVTLAHIFAVYAEELRQIELTVSEVLLAFEYRRGGCMTAAATAAIPVEWNFPPIAGAMMWLEQHMRRCDAFADPDLNEFVKKLLAGNNNPLTASRYEQLSSRRDILTTKLSNLQLKIWHNWQQTIDKRIATGLDAQVMQRSGSYNVTNATDLSENRTDALQVNFSPKLFALLKETKYLLAMQRANSRRVGAAAVPVDGDTAAGEDEVAELLPTVAIAHALPLSLLALYAQRDDFWQRKIKLIKISEFYNGIGAGARSSGERQLIRGEVAAIDECVEAACETMTWRSYDSTLIAEIYAKSQQLFQRLAQTHQNVDAILASIRRWSQEPLHQRSLYGKNLLELRHQQERLRTRLLQCEETKMLLNRLLIANFCLFFNYDEQNIEVYSRDLSVQEFLREFPDEQRRKYNAYLASVDEMICSEVRRAMKIRFSKSFC